MVVATTMYAPTQEHTVMRSFRSPLSGWQSNCWQRSGQSSYAGTRHGHRLQGRAHCNWRFPKTQFQPDARHHFSHRPEGHQNHPADVTQTKHQKYEGVTISVIHTVYKPLGTAVILRKLKSLSAHLARGDTRSSSTNHRIKDPVAPVLLALC